MAKPVFRNLSRALEAPEEGRELWSGVPVEEEPAYAEELFRKASDTALARENALAKTGYVPAGTGPVVEPSLDSTLAAMPSGLRSRKPLDFTPDTTKLQGKLAGFLGGDRLLQGPGYARPLSDEDLAAETERATRLMSEDAGRPIPTASAPVTKDAAAPVTAALPSTGPQTPAGKPDAEGTPGLPAPSSEGAGGDVLGRLGLGQALVRALEGSGSVIAGRDLRSGAAETLGERMKQIEALRAKREERAMEIAREDEQSTALVSQYKSLAAQGLVPDLPMLDKLPPKQAASLIKTYGSLPGLVQRAEKTKAEIPLVKERVEDVKAGKELKEAKAEDIPLEGQSRRALRQAQIDALRNKARVDVTTSSKEAREAKADARAAEGAVARAMERANDKNDVTNTVNNFMALEEVAPGFAKGQKPEWIGRFTLQKAMKVPAISDKAAALNSALENFTANIRKTLFGASLTGNEKASFDLIVNRKLTATPEQLAAAVNTLRRGAARFAQNHFTTSMEFHPQETARVLRSSAVYGPALREGGIYSDVWTLPAAPAPAGGASSRQQKPQASEGYTPLWNKAQGKWQEIPNEKAEAAKASGRFEE